jgi:phosphoadenosine phosphosulfate reductase
MISRQIPINPLYFKGYNRIGCWACPNNGKFDEYLISKTHPALSKEWTNYLMKYANANGKTPDWVFLGKWKQRTTKYEKFEICTCQNVCTRGAKFLFMLKDRQFTEEILEFFKIFGNKTVEFAGGQKMIRIEGPKMVIASIIGTNALRVMFTDMSCFSRSIFEVRKQLEKAVNCVNCGACVGSCRVGAIQCNGRLKITESCVHCLECVTSKHLKQSCIALHYKNKRSTIERSSLSLTTQTQKVPYPSVNV